MKKSLSLWLAWSLTVAWLPGQEAKAFKFEIETLGGQGFDQDDFKNNLLIVDFWGTWCPPCRQALPGMVALYRKYKHHGLEIVGLNYENNDDLEDAAETVRAFAAEVGITYQLAKKARRPPRSDRSASTIYPSVLVNGINLMAVLLRRGVGRRDQVVTRLLGSSASGSFTPPAFTCSWNTRHSSWKVCVWPRKCGIT